MTEKSVQIEISTHPGWEAPFRPLWAAASRRGLCQFNFGSSEDAFRAAVRRRFPKAELTKTDSPHPILGQVLEYLSGTRREFTLTLDLHDLTPFQQAVYRAVQRVAYGQTAAYGQIASQLGRPHAARAVGTANGVNPLPIIIPCHRLVGSDGSLRGYGGAGGIDTKAWLLALEKGSNVPAR